MRWAGERLADDLTVTTLAGRAGYSEAHFSRLFRAVAGQSPACWLAGCRVARAAERLRSSHDHVLDVALECGFADVTTFARAFRRHTGLPPTAYRRAAGARPQPPAVVREAGTVELQAFSLCGLVADVAADPVAPARLWQALRQRLAEDGRYVDPRHFRQVAFWRGNPEALYTCAAGFLDETSGDLPLPFARLNIPAGVCRRFVAEPSAAGFAAAYAAIYGALLPASGDRLAADFVIERPRSDGSDGVEIWVPIAATVDDDRP